MELESLPDLRSRPDNEVSIEADRANLDKIKALGLGLRSTGHYDTELVQSYVIRKLSRPRIKDAFTRLWKKYLSLNFDRDTLLNAIEASIYIDEVAELRSLSGRSHEGHDSRACENQRVSSRQKIRMPILQWQTHEHRLSKIYDFRGEEATAPGIKALSYVHLPRA